MRSQQGNSIIVPADLPIRALSAIVMIAVLVGAFLSGFTGIVILAVILAGILGFETAKMANAELGPALVYGCALAVAVAGIGVNFFVLFLGGLAGLIVFAVRFIPDHKFLTFGLAFWALMGLSAATLLAGHYNIYVLVSLVILVVLTDLGGYCFGHLLKGPKLWPQLSPKKTWSGAVGSIVLGGFGAWAFFTETGLNWVASLFVPVVSPFAFELLVESEVFITMGVGLVLVFATIAGDLAISAAKRIYHVKDSSRLIPGHGGLWDRFDGFAAAAFALWVVAVLGLIG